MAKSSIVSNFQFKSYKIDNSKFSVQKDINLLLFNKTLLPEMLLTNISIRRPLFNKKQNMYIGGLDTGIRIEEIKKGNGDKEINRLLTLEVGIAGAFFTNGKFEDEIEKNLVRIQIPALLFPYVRATISSIFSNAGFGAVVLPLINIQEMAKELTKDFKVKVIE